MTKSKAATNAVDRPGNIFLSEHCVSTRREDRYARNAQFLSTIYEEVCIPAGAYLKQLAEWGRIRNTDEQVCRSSPDFYRRFAVFARYVDPFPVAEPRHSWCCSKATHSKNGKSGGEPASRTGCTRFGFACTRNPCLIVKQRLSWIALRTPPAGHAAGSAGAQNSPDRSPRYLIRHFQ